MRRSGVKSAEIQTARNIDKSVIFIIIPLKKQTDRSVVPNGPCNDPIITTISPRYPSEKSVDGSQRADAEQFDKASIHSVAGSHRHTSLDPIALRPALSRGLPLS